MRWLPALLIVLVLVIPLLSAAFSLVAVGTFVFDRGFYVQILADERLYSIPDAISGATWVASFTELEPLIRGATGPAIREVLTPEYLRSQAGRLLDQVFIYLRGRGPLQLSIDLAPAKRALAGEAGKRFAADLAAELPICAGSTSTPAGTLPSCRPRKWTVEQTARQIESALPAVLARMPDTQPIGESVPLPWPGFSVTRVYFASVLALLLAGIGCWLGAAFAGSSNVRGRLFWLGGSLLAPAFFTLLCGLATLAPATIGWVRYGIAAADLPGFGFSAVYPDALVGAARIAVQRTATGFLATGGIASGVALGLLAWGWSIPRAGRKPSTESGAA